MLAQRNDISYYVFQSIHNANPTSPQTNKAKQIPTVLLKDNFYLLQEQYIMMIGKTENIKIFSISFVHIQ